MTSVQYDTVSLNLSALEMFSAAGISQFYSKNSFVAQGLFVIKIIPAVILI
jgi:hypothetical protein